MYLELFVRIAYHRGPDGVAKMIKEHSAQAQSRAVGAPPRPQKNAFVPPLMKFIRGSLKSGWTIRNAWVFAGVGRAIPPPPTEKTPQGLAQRKAAVREWRKALTSTHDVPDEVLADLKRYVAKRVRILQGRGSPVKYGEIKLNASACIERSRGKGGTYGVILDKAKKLTGPVWEPGMSMPVAYPQDFHPKEGDNRHGVNPLAAHILRWGTTLGPQLATAEQPFRDLEKKKAVLLSQVPEGERDKYKNLHPRTMAEYKTEPTLDPKAAKAVRVETLKGLASLVIDDELRKWERDGFPHLPMRMVLLPERGHKLRIATMSPAAVVAAAQRLNATAIRLLKRDRVHAYSLLGAQGIPSTIKNGCRQNKGRPDFVMTSSDLSKASDLLTLPVNRAVIEGLLDGLGETVPPLHRRVIPKMVGKMVNQVDGTAWNQEQFETERGALMGIPLAWPILSWVQEFCAIRATKDANLNGRPFTICGDDLGAAWTRKAQAAYFRRVAQIGLKINHYKTFESQRGMIFVEKLFTLVETTNSGGPKRVESKARIDEKLKPIGLITSDEPREVGTPVLWDWIEFALDKHKPTAPTKTYKLARSRRPLLSAILTAKKRSSEQRDETTPLWLTLAGILRQEVKECSQPWRARTVEKIARSAHPLIYRIWNSSGLPLHWPEAFGGWGLPGKQDAPIALRRLAALAVTGKPEICQKILILRQTSRAPQHCKKHLKEVLERLHERPKTYTKGRAYESLSDLGREATSRVLAYHSLDPNYDKAQRIQPKWSVKKLVRRIKAILAELPKTKLRPINPANAVRFAKEYVEEVRVDMSENPSLIMTASLHYTGTPDRMSEMVQTLSHHRPGSLEELPQPPPDENPEGTVEETKSESRGPEDKPQAAQTEPRTTGSVERGGGIKLTFRRNPNGPGGGEADASAPRNVGRLKIPWKWNR